MVKPFTISRRSAKQFPFTTICIRYGTGTRPISTRLPCFLTGLPGPRWKAEQKNMKIYSSTGTFTRLSPTVGFLKFPPVCRMYWAPFIISGICRLTVSAPETRLNLKCFWTTSFGKFHAIKIKPFLIKGTMFEAGEKMTVWVTDDPNHIPIRIQASIRIGNVKADLVEYQNSRWPLQREIK